MGIRDLDIRWIVVLTIIDWIENGGFLPFILSVLDLVILKSYTYENLKVNTKLWKMRESEVDFPQMAPLFSFGTRIKCS